MYTTIQIDGHPVIVYICDDLSDEMLAEHFAQALNSEDYDYCEALAAEASGRGVKLVIL